MRLLAFDVPDTDEARALTPSLQSARLAALVVFVFDGPSCFLATLLRTPGFLEMPLTLTSPWLGLDPGPTPSSGPNPAEGLLLLFCCFMMNFASSEANAKSSRASSLPSCAVVGILWSTALPGDADGGTAAAQEDDLWARRPFLRSQTWPTFHTSIQAQNEDAKSRSLACSSRASLHCNRRRSRLCSTAILRQDCTASRAYRNRQGVRRTKRNPCIDLGVPSLTERRCNFLRNSVTAPANEHQLPQAADMRLRAVAVRIVISAFRRCR